MIREIAEAGVIESSNSPWAAPALLVKKKEDTWRFCVDYRHLNDVPREDSYILPRIDDTVDKVAGSQWFRSLDLRSGYWQVECKTQDGFHHQPRARRLPKKCNMLQHETRFLGHVVGPEGVATDPAKLEAVRNWHIPRNVSEVQSFLGLASYYQRFVCDFASIASPLQPECGDHSQVPGV